MNLPLNEGLLIPIRLIFANFSSSCMNRWKWTQQSLILCLWFLWCLCWGCWPISGGSTGPISMKTQNHTFELWCLHSFFHAGSTVASWLRWLANTLNLPRNWFEAAHFLQQISEIIWFDYITLPILERSSQDFTKDCKICSRRFNCWLHFDTCALLFIYVQN